MGEQVEIPPRHGEGDHVEHGGGGPPLRPTQRSGTGGPPPSLRATSPFRGGISRAYLLALGIFVADQLSKWVMIGPLALEQMKEIVLLPIFSFTWVRNFGISLGLAQAENDLQRWLLVALTSAIAIAVAYWIRREGKAGDRFALALVLGGALGNIVDRVRFGYVVDFLDLHFGEVRPFYVFNVADAAISIGVVILLLRALLIRDASSKNGPPEGTNEHA